MYDDNNHLDQDEFQTVVSNLEAERNTPETPTQPVDDDLPEKLRGKSPAEIAKMYVEAEKLIGRQAQEVGEIRKLADELIRSKVQPAPQPVPQADDDIDEVEFFANPKEAIKKAVSNHPAVKQAQEATQKLSRVEAARSMAERHPDATQIVNSQEFQQFVSATPLRQKLFQAAHYQFNVEAADELLTTFKELYSRKQQQEIEQTKQQFDQNNRKALKDAAVSVGGTGDLGPKIYRRADLIELQLRDPDRYEALLPEILQAYSEERVR